MRAALFHRVGEPLAIESVADPEAGPGEVVIAVSHAGICGSDLHVTEYGAVAPGTILGHEFSGAVVALGADVGAGVRIGDRVTALPLHACRACEACDAGLPALCSANLFTGMAPQYPGAYAEYVRAPAAMLQRLPDGVSFEDGAMIEPLAVAHHAVELGEVTRGARVLVIGAGPIGAGVTLFARLMGAAHVVVSERSPERAERALALGATALIDPRQEDVAARFTALTGGMPEIVFECVGVPGLLQQAIALAGIRGRVVVAGVCFGEDRIQPLSALMREISIRFSQCYTERDFATVIDAVARGEARPRPMHSATVGLDALPAAFEGLRGAPAGCKILIDPQRR